MSHTPDLHRIYAQYTINRLPIPVERKQTAPSPLGKYPFACLIEPGMCFRLLLDDDPKLVRVASVQFGGRRGWRFLVRKTPFGHMCWRIS